MVLKIISTILKLCSLGLVMMAGGLWARAEVITRPKNRDEQTIIGGAIWSQILIPIGMIISSCIDEELYPFVQAYFLISGSILLALTGFMLVYDETKKLKLQRQLSVAEHTIEHLTPDSYDKIYFTIGVISLVAAVITIADFIIIVIMGFIKL